MAKRDVAEYPGLHARVDIHADLCQYCKREAERDGTIEDFNSVWFGLGPDCKLAPTLAWVVSYNPESEQSVKIGEQPCLGETNGIR